MLEETQVIDRTKLNKVINGLWKLHDAALSEGNSQSAQNYASQAFDLLSKLPENMVSLSTPQ